MYVLFLLLLHPGMQNQDLETLKALIEAGANLNQQSRSVQFTPIMVAAYNGYADIVQFLKNQGADLSLKDADGDTALELAKARNHEEVIKILKEKLDLRSTMSNPRTGS